MKIKLLTLLALASTATLAQDIDYRAYVDFKDDGVMETEIYSYESESKASQSTYQLADLACDDLGGKVVTIDKKQWKDKDNLLNNSVTRGGIGAVTKKGWLKYKAKSKKYYSKLTFKCQKNDSDTTKKE